MPKLPAVTQKPLTAFFSSPASSNKKQTIGNSGLSTNRKNGSSANTDCCEHDAVASKRPKLEDSNGKGDVPDCAKPQLAALFNSSESLREEVNKKVAELKRKLASRSNRAVLDLIQGLNAEWMSVLTTQLQSDGFQKLADFVAAERSRNIPIYPPPDQVFSWSQLCPPAAVRVVILGQDPYHGPKQAHGLAFSVQRPLPAPPSLINMYKEIGSKLDTSIPWPPKHGDLTGWAKQGVLLLNAVLTVRASSPNSHKDKGWELITDAVIRHLSKERSNLVFMLWGAHAQKQGSGIDRKRHYVLQAPHPSPLSASRGFFGCGHFIKANEFLKEHGLVPIDWTKLD